MDSGSLKKRYPEESEINALVQAQDFVTLLKRIKYRTYDIMIEDALNRPEDPNCVPIWMLTLILYVTDMKTVHELACHHVIFYRILMDDSFWRERYKRDLMGLPVRLPEYVQPVGSEKHKNQPWRRFYIVSRTVLRLFMRYMLANIEFNDERILFYDYEIEGSKIRIIVRDVDENQLGESTVTQFDLNFFRKFLNHDNVCDFAKGCYDIETDKANKFLEFVEGKDIGFFCHNHSVTVSQCVNRGYVDQNEERCAF